MPDNLLVIAGAVLVIAFSIAVPAGILIYLPSDYLHRPDDSKRRAAQHPLRFTLAAFVRNLLGILLIALGAALSIPGIPGQGVLLVIAGLLAMDFPGKKRVLMWLFGYPTVLRTTNALRRRFNRPPLKAKRVSAD